MKHIIVILEGVDKTGKSTAIKSIKKQYENVHLMTGKHELYDQFRKPMDDYYKSITIELAQDVISASKLSTILRSMFLIIDAQPEKQHIFVFDRLILSAMIYAQMFRKSFFKVIWDGDEAYAEYAYAFEKVIEESGMFISKTFIAIRPDGFEFEDDDDHRVKVSSSQMEKINDIFKNVELAKGQYEYVKVDDLNIGILETRCIDFIDKNLTK